MQTAKWNNNGVFIQVSVISLNFKTKKARCVLRETPLRGMLIEVPEDSLVELAFRSTSYDPTTQAFFDKTQSEQAEMVFKLQEKRISDLKAERQTKGGAKGHSKGHSTKTTLKAKREERISKLTPERQDLLNFLME